MTAKALAEAKARCDKATEGPWALTENGALVFYAGEHQCHRVPANLDNSMFLFRARTDMPRLLHDHELLLAVAMAAARQRQAQARYHAAMAGNVPWEHGMEAALLFAEADLDAALRACGLGETP